MRFPWKTVGHGAGLILALTFVFFSAFIPHLDTFDEHDNDPFTRTNAIPRLAEASWQWVNGERDEYPYTIHADENVHWVYMAGLQRHDQAFISYPNGEPTQSQGFFSLRGAIHERGFHIIGAEVQELTGISFFQLFRFLPAAWLTLTAFGMYAALKPHPMAIPAAAFVGMLPTTARFLGPGILVPIGFVLAWLPAAAILSEPARKRGAAAALLLLVVGWAFFVHLIGGFAVVALIAMASLVGTKRERKAALTLAGIALIPLIALWRGFQAGVQREIALEEFLPIDLTIFDSFGLWSLYAWAAGMLLLSLRLPEKRRQTVVAFAGLSVGALGLIVSTLVFDLDTYATYARWHSPFFLAATVPMAYLVVQAGRYARQGLEMGASVLRRRPRGARAVAVVLPLVLTVAIIAPGLKFHLQEPYYHVLEDGDLEQYEWVNENVGPEHEVFLTHPWKAPVMAAVTGKQPYAWLGPGAPPVNGEAYDRFARTGGSPSLFILNDITFGITLREPPYPYFDAAEESRMGYNTVVWGMNETLTQELYEIRQMERGR